MQIAQDLVKLLAFTRGTQEKHHDKLPGDYKLESNNNKTSDNYYMYYIK